jgi:hypothetical protein
MSWQNYDAGILDATSKFYERDLAVDLSAAANG